MMFVERLLDLLAILMLASLILLSRQDLSWTVGLFGFCLIYVDLIAVFTLIGPTLWQFYSAQHKGGDMIAESNDAGAIIVITIATST